MLLNRLRKRPVLEFVGIVVLCGCVEYTTSVVLEILHNGERWWDYSGYFLNLNGRICAEGLLVFGIGGICHRLHAGAPPGQPDPAASGPGCPDTRCACCLSRPLPWTAVYSAETSQQRQRALRITRREPRACSLPVPPIHTCKCLYCPEASWLDGRLLRRLSPLLSPPCGRACLYVCCPDAPHRLSSAGGAGEAVFHIRRLLLDGGAPLRDPVSGSPGARPPHPVSGREKAARLPAAESPGRGGGAVPDCRRVPVGHCERPDHPHHRLMR